MAYRKLLFLNTTYGFPTESLATNDVAQIGTGFELDMQSKKITGLATATVANDAVGHGQSGIVFAGLTLTGELAMGSSKITGLASATASGDAIAYGQSSASLAGLTLTGELAMGNSKITGLGTPSASTDAATKGYVDGVAQGLDVKASVRAATTANITLSGTQNIDGVAIIADDRVLVKNQNTGAENGIYLCKAGSWERATDADTSADVTSGMFTFVSEGTTNGDTGWVLSTNDPITLDTTSLTFTQFSAAGVYSAGDGLTLAGTVFSVNAGDGIEIASDNVKVKLDGGTLSVGSSGLKVADAGITATQIATSVAGAGLTGGGGNALAVGAGTGITVNADDVALDTAHARNVDHTAVSLTAGDGLTGGGDISANRTFAVGAGNGITVNADDVAVKADTSGPAAGDGTSSITVSSAGVKVARSRIVADHFTASAAIAAYDAVYPSANNKVAKGDCTDVTKVGIIGLASASISGDGEVGLIVHHGPMTGALSGASVGAYYYIGSTGQPVLYSALSGGDRAIRLGYALNATDLFVHLLDMGVKAA